MVIEFSHKLVKVQGGGDLLSLYQYVLGNRVTFIAEADRATEKPDVQDDDAAISELMARDRNDQ